MVLQNPITIAARSGSTLNRTSNSLNITTNTMIRNNRNNNNNNNNNGNMNSFMSQQRPVIDLLVAFIAVPILILCALQLEKNLHEMATSPQSRWLVFALGIGMLIVSVIICGYVTHRMGVCIWTGPLDEAGNRTNGRSMPRINSQNDVLRIVDSLPPSYDSVIKFDIPPPSYDCLVIDIEQCKEEDEEIDSQTNNGKPIPMQTTALHM